MLWGLWLIMFLLVGSIFDLKTKKVPILLLIGGVIVSFVKLCFVPFATLGDTIFSITPGIIMMGIAWITQKHMGMADGIALLIIGMILGGDVCTLILVVALFIESFGGIILIVLRKATKETELPFFPFLGMGYLIINLINMRSI